MGSKVDNQLFFVTMNTDRIYFTEIQDPNSWEPKRNTDTNCLWDNLTEEEKLKPYAMSCPCRKCSAWCVS